MNYVHSAASECEKLYVAYLDLIKHKSKCTHLYFRGLTHFFIRLKNKNKKIIEDKRTVLDPSFMFL